MKSKSLIFIYLILSIQNVYSQDKSVLIKGSIIGFKNVAYISSVSTIKSATDFGFVENDTIHIKSDSSFSKRITLTKTQILFLKCAGVEKEIIASPGDTIEIYFSKLKSPDTIKSGPLTVTNFEKATIKGSQVPKLTFFDSLRAKYHSLLDYVVNSIPDPLSQKNAIDALFKSRIDYLNYYVAKYHLSDEFKSLGYLEIKGAYLLALSSRVFDFNRKEFPKGYFSTLDEQNFTWENCIKSRLYTSAAHSYCAYYLRTVPFGKDAPEEKLSEQYTIITNYIKDISLRDYLLTLTMHEFLEQHPSNYKEIYSKYLILCANPSYKEAIQTEYKEETESLLITIPETILTKTRFIKSSNNTEISLKELLSTLKKDNILVDFWASWCKPCLHQAPFLSAFERSYKDRVGFLSISVDRDYTAFTSGLKTFNLSGEQYLLKDQVSSPFLKLLKFKSIPRYILLDNKFHILRFKTPMPEDKAEFDKMLTEL